MSSLWSLDDRSARAVEVVATLGDSIVDVRHCIDPRGGTLKPATRAMFAVGAACLLASAIAFAVALADAADDRDRLDAHLAASLPAYAFRPEAHGGWLELVMLGGLYAGIASLAIGLVRAPRERTRPGYRIGTAPGVDQPLAAAPSADFPLVAAFGDDFVINVGAGIECEWIEDGVATPLAELYAVGFARASASIPGAFELPIPSSGRIRAQCGNTTFFVAAVAGPRVESLPVWRIDVRMIAYVVGALAAHLTLLYWLPPTPDDGAGCAIELEHDGDEPGYEVVGSEEVAPPEWNGWICVERGIPPYDDEEADPVASRSAMLREQALETARWMLLDASDEADPPPPLPRVSIGLPSVQGGYDKWVLRRYVKHRFNELARCYENARIAKPWLEGTAIVQFVIATDGTVRVLRGIGMDAEVARCLAAVVEQIELPRPRDGGPSLVSYPFTFHAGGVR